MHLAALVKEGSQPTLAANCTKVRIRRRPVEATAYSVEKLDSFRAGSFLTILPSNVVTLLFRYGSGLEPVSRAFLGFGRLRLGQIRHVRRLDRAIRGCQGHECV
ncbi:hypothetical protein OAN307_c25490 [Octadecabacter antarcticus 307]|uniref:Uncharacterized protein n=1 Tax=Octadecabacter antarcticus 307 TaxID=391626 RepID=M9RCK4_9RHOB|nr:hypothetical protein OAN307_c25490 [Octadecabacter antarcticus 307]